MLSIGRGYIARLIWPTGAGAFRFWLAAVVVIHHFFRIEVGKAPVLVFLALSGYWIQKVWPRSYAVTRRPWITFLVSRWWRIAPMMILSSALCLAVVYALNLQAERNAFEAAPLRQAFSTVFALGYALLPLRANGPGWSLDIEMQFYILAPLFIWTVRRYSVAVSLALALAIQQLGLVFVPLPILSLFLPWFVIGMAAAEYDWKPPQRMADFAFALAILLVPAVLLSPWHALLIDFDAPQGVNFNMLLAGLALPFALNTARRRGDPTDRALADQSYTIYMVHWAVIDIYRNIAWHDVQTRIAVAFVWIAVSVLVSHLAWRYVDRPLNRQRQRWVDARRIGDSAVQPPKADLPRAKRDDISASFA